MTVFLLTALTCRGEEKSYNIVFIGNSITHGAKHEDWTKTAPPNECARWLSEQDGIGQIYFLNAGKSGKTTFHFLPDKRKVVPAGDSSYFNEVVEGTRKLVAKHPDLPLVFSIMLGTNDSAERPLNHATTKSQYVSNMTQMIDSLLAIWPDAHVVLNRVIYYTPGFITKSGSRFDEESLGRIRNYYESYPEIIANSKIGHVHIGDTLAHNYFKENLFTDIVKESDANGHPYYLHPNEKGAKALGEYWGKAILPLLPSVKSQEIYVSPFLGGKKATISFTFDDGLQEHFTVLRNELNKRNFPATFAIVGSRVGKDFKGVPAMGWSQLKELVADGHEISNHGYSHVNVTKLSKEELRHELQANDSLIYDSLGVWPRSFIYPGNRRDKETIPVCEAGRAGSRTHLRSLGGKSGDTELRQWTENLMNNGEWGVTMTHGIHYGYDCFKDAGVLWRYLDYVDSLKSQIWIERFDKVATYVKERDNVRLSLERMADGTILVRPVLNLDKSIFNMPLTLTVVSELPVKALQNGRILDVKKQGKQYFIGFNPYEGEIVISSGDNPTWDDTSNKHWDSRFKQITMPDRQKAYIYRSSRKNMPLIVSLHTWSGDYRQNAPISKEVVAKDWNYIHPDFQGPNNKAEALCSTQVITDIENAIRWAVKELDANPDEVHVVGVSGGGLATLATFMQGTYPVKSFSAWAPISDVEEWYWESLGRGQKYADHIRSAIPDAHGCHINKEEATKRSPIRMGYPKKRRKGTVLYLYEGIHDGYKGSVPITHTLNMFNRIQGERKYGLSDMREIFKKAEKDATLIPKEEVEYLVVKRTGRNMDSEKTLLGRRIHLLREGEDVKVVIFEGAHEQLPGALSLIPVSE